MNSHFSGRSDDQHHQMPHRRVRHPSRSSRAGLSAQCSVRCGGWPAGCWRACLGRGGCWRWRGCSACSPWRSAGMAHADGLFSHPTYTDPQQTLFEAHGPFAYTLTIQPDDAAQSGLGLTAALYQIVGVICNLLLWIALLPLYGAFLLLEWFLNLTFYRDSAAQIDAAVQTLADQVFWPLISATVAVGAVVTYTRWRTDGRGWLSDIAWVIAAATLAIGFVTQPSQIMLQVDSLREQLAAKVITGTTTALTPDTQSVTGYQNPALTGPAQEVAARSLVAGLWDSFGSTPWCLAQFHELDICKAPGRTNSPATTPGNNGNTPWPTTGRSPSSAPGRTGSEGWTSAASGTC